MVCVILGDSIAVIMHEAMPKCEMRAMGGINSSDYAARFVQPISADLTVISIGANDRHGTAIETLRLIRSRVSGKAVWLVPNIRRKTTLDAVAAVASEFGDRFVHTASYVGPRLHPTLAEAQKIASAIW